MIHRKRPFTLPGYVNHQVLMTSWLGYEDRIRLRYLCSLNNTFFNFDSNCNYNVLFSMLKIIGNGLIQKWKTFYWPKKKQCKTLPGVQPLTLKDTQGVFYLFAAQIMVSAIVLALEIVHFSKHRILGAFQRISIRKPSLSHLIRKP